jgi:hypothetical protein
VRTTYLAEPEVRLQGEVVDFEKYFSGAFFQNPPEFWKSSFITQSPIRGALGSVDW